MVMHKKKRHEKSCLLKFVGLCSIKCVIDKKSIKNIDIDFDEVWGKIVVNFEKIIHQFYPENF